MGSVKFVVFVVQKIMYNLFSKEKVKMLNNYWHQQNQEFYFKNYFQKMGLLFSENFNTALLEEMFPTISDMKNANSAKKYFRKKWYES